MLAVLRLRNFRLFWTGECISLLGDQFYLIALPWLVLQLTNNAFAMGMVLAMAGIPRTIFILLGGVMTDRFSPRATLLFSNIFRGLLVTLLAGLLISGSMQVWMLYVFALAFGIGDAFYFPASSSIIPQLVDKHHLQSANLLVQGITEISLFLGPVLAGILIAVYEVLNANNVSNPAQDTLGISFAFGIDAVSFAFSAITLWFLRLNYKHVPQESDHNVLLAIREGFDYMWGDVTLRSWFIIIATSNFLFNGPFAIGIPVLARDRFPEGAAAFGILMSGFGGGSLLGTLLAGILPKPKAQYMGSIVMLIISTQGISLGLLAFAPTTALATLLTFAIGVANGYIVVVWGTWLEIVTPQHMLGRVWSLIMFASLGIQPLSQAVAGALINFNIVGLFIFSGILLTIVNILTALDPDVRAMATPGDMPDLNVADAIRRTGELPALQLGKTGRLRQTGILPALPDEYS